MWHVLVPQGLIIIKVELMRGGKSLDVLTGGRVCRDPVEEWLAVELHADGHALAKLLEWGLRAHELAAKEVERNPTTRRELGDLVQRC